MNNMKQKSDKPPKYMVDRLNKHLEVIFGSVECDPKIYSTRTIDSFRMAKKEFYKLKKYRDNNE